MPPHPAKGPCSYPCSKVLKFMTDHDLPASIGTSLPPYTDVSGYRHVNVFVQFSQQAANEAPVDLGVIFAFDSAGKLGARRYANLEENLPGPQSTNFIEVSGSGSWHGSPHNISSYLARLPVMAPFMEVFVYNRAPLAESQRLGLLGCLTGGVGRHGQRQLSRARAAEKAGRPYPPP
jgi:hypothetical protein